MQDKEALEMMQRVLHDIENMRRVIDHLRPKAEAYDNLVTVLHLLPKPSVGMGEDVTWTLRKRIKEIETSLEPKETPDA